MDQLGKVANSARVQLNRENNISLPAFAPKNLVSRDGFGGIVPRQLAHLHSQAECGAYEILPEIRGGGHCSILNRHTPSGQLRVYKVMSGVLVVLRDTASTPSY